MNVDELCDLLWTFAAIPADPAKAWARAPEDVRNELAFAEFSRVWRARTPFARARRTRSTVLWLRVRCHRGTQAQIPLKKFPEVGAFFRGSGAPIDPDGQERSIREAGDGNTWKFEVPEARRIEDPLVRFEHRADGRIHFTVQEARPWMDVLRTCIDAERGRATISDLARATIAVFD